MESWDIVDAVGRCWGEKRRGAAETLGEGELSVVRTADGTSSNENTEQKQIGASASKLEGIYIEHMDGHGTYKKEMR